MKRTLPFALLLAVFLAAPAVPQGTEGKVEDLDTVVAALRDKVAKQEAMLQQHEARMQEVVAYLQAQKAEAKELGKRLDAARTGGFTFPAPNTEAREALLAGLERWARQAAVKVPGTPEGEDKAPE